MSGYSGASDQVKLALVLLLSTLAVHVLALGAPYWSTRARVADVDRHGNVNLKRSGGHAGLWTACTEGECYERFNLWAPGFVHWCQAFMTSSLVLLLISCVLLFLYLWHRNYDRDKRLVSVNMVFCGIASIFTLLSVLAWPAGQRLQAGEYLNWPYALAVLSCLLSGGVAYLHRLELATPDYSKPAPPPASIYSSSGHVNSASMPMLTSKSGSTLLGPSRDVSKDFSRDYDLV